MARKRRPFTRPPVVLSPCRGCGAPSAAWVLLPGGVFRGDCGIDDPEGIGRARPATAEELALAATRRRFRSEEQGAMTDRPPLYNYLGHPAADLTDDQRSVLDASEREIGLEMALGSGIPGEIGAMLAEMTRRGWWAAIKTPFSPGESPNGHLYWVGFTPLGTTGWNGRPDHQVGDVTLRGALWRAVLLTLLSTPAQHEVRAAGTSELPGLEDVR